MSFVPRQIVATVTAVSVLLCGIVCACGGSLPGSPTAVAVATSSAGPAEHHEHHSHCHGHSGEEADHHDGGGHDKTPAPCKDGDHSCSHCQSAVTAISEAGKNPSDLAPLAHPAGTMLPASFAAPAPVAISVRWTAIGDPSPPPGPTLLSLHCALNT